MSRVCEVTGGFYGGTWSPDGKSIIFSGFSGSGKLFEVAAGGGEPRVILSPSGSEGTVGEQLGGLVWPHFLLTGEGRALVVAAYFPHGMKLMLLDLDTEQYKVLAKRAMVRQPSYSRSGHIVYEGARNSIWALPFSLTALEATGEPFLIADSGAFPSVAADQTLIFADRSGGGRRLVSVNRQGETIGEIGQPQRPMRYPTLSPDERHVAVRSSPQIWVHEVGRAMKNLLPFADRVRGRPIWSGSGREILFNSTQGIHRGAADGAGLRRQANQPTARQPSSPSAVNVPPR